MKKSMLSIIGLTTLMTLTGCGTNSVTPVEDNSIIFPAESITLNADSKALLVGEKFQMELYVQPLLAAGGKFVYESSDSSVASVSKSGLVKAKKHGHATVTVYSKDNPEVKAEMKLYVFKEETNKNTLKSKLSAMATYQEEHVTAPRKLRTLETEKRTLYVDGDVRTISMTYYDFITSKNDAYFKFGINGYDVRYYGGPEVRDSYSYHFYTDADYHSFIFKDSYESSETHNYTLVASEFYLGTGTTRDEVIYAMLGSFFVSGSDISEDNITDSMSSDMFQYTPNAGGYGTDEVYAVYSASSSNNKATIKMEQNLNIPAGTIYSEKDDIRLYWYQGNVKSYKLAFTLKYKIDGVQYELLIERNYTFQRDGEFSFSIPNPANYHLEDSIFDL